MVPVSKGVTGSADALSATYVLEGQGPRHVYRFANEGFSEITVLTRTAAELISSWVVLLFVVFLLEPSIVTLAIVLASVLLNGRVLRTFARRAYKGLESRRILAATPNAVRFMAWPKVNHVKIHRRVIVIKTDDKTYQALSPKNLTELKTLLVSKLGTEKIDSETTP